MPSDTFFPDGFMSLIRMRLLAWLALARGLLPPAHSFCAARGLLHGAGQSGIGETRRWTAVLRPSPRCSAVAACAQPKLRRDSKNRSLIPFERARDAVQRLSLRSEEEWDRWVMDNKPGITSHRNWYLPDNPAEAYDEEWESWDDWLGVMRPYEEAVQLVSTLNITSQEQWWDFLQENPTQLQRLRVPARPHLYYGRQWGGYDEWLSLPNTPLVLPRNYGRGDV
ncbi:hypothetical protein AB1Y20_015655 [Prymnesium parvum]|uniref:Uncharacterized protein n=1 Tax=Prymnesium parvum TaxID=97485 RepID=A0AB34K243_PRYPA